MPDAAGKIKGIALTGKAGETLDRIKREALLAEISAIGQEIQGCHRDTDGDGDCGWCAHLPGGCPEREPECKTCGDTRSVRVHSHEDYGVSFECESCPDCCDCEGCFEAKATHKIAGVPVCENCWERGMNLD